MKLLILALSLASLLVAGCGAKSVVGLDDDARAVQPAGQCSIYVQLC